MIIMYEVYFNGEILNQYDATCSAIIYKDNKFLFDKSLHFKYINKKEIMFYGLYLLLILIDVYCEEKAKVLAKTDMNLDVILNFMKNKNLKNICKEEDIRLDFLGYIEKIKRKNISIKFENVSKEENRSIIKTCKLSLH